MPTRTRDDEPLAVQLDYGVAYSLYLRPPRRRIVKVSWEEDGAGGAVTRACAFELDLKRTKLVLLGRKDATAPKLRYSPHWFCRWAKAALKDR